MTQNKDGQVVSEEEKMKSAKIDKKKALNRKKRKKRKKKEAEEKQNLDKENQKRLQELERIHSKEEIANQLKNRRVKLATDIEQTQQQIDNCHDDQLEDLENK